VKPVGESNYFYSFQLFCLLVSKTNFPTGSFEHSVHSTPQYFDFMFRFWHIREQYEGLALLVIAVGWGWVRWKAFSNWVSLTTPWWQMIMGYWWNTKYSGENVPQCQICLITNPTYLSEVINQQLNGGLMVFGYQLGYWLFHREFYILSFYAVNTSGHMECVKKMFTNTFLSLLETEFQNSSNKF
jgi:hypothetical protein